MKEPLNMDFLTEGTATVLSQESGTDPLVNPGQKRPDESSSAILPQLMEKMLKRKVDKASAEWVALSREVFMITSLPLGEVKTYVNAPLFGLTEEVYGLQHTGQGLQGETQGENCIGYLRLKYLSPRYKQYRRYRHDQTFVVATCLFPKDVRPLFGCGWSMLEPICIPGSSFHMMAKDATFTIDGKNFKGRVIHYTAPVRYSSFTLYHERIGLTGEALGPSLEELIQIVESLHDLNSKVVE
jgi:hypothetical protein